MQEQIMHKGITIECVDGVITAKFKWTPELAAIMKRLDGIRFDSEKRRWIIEPQELPMLKEMCLAREISIDFEKSYTKLFEDKIEPVKGFDFLFEYQKEAVSFAYDRKNVFLGHSMGLGKGIMALCTIKKIIDVGAKRVLILVPLSLIGTWLEENRKFLGMDIKVVKGTKAERAVMWKQDGILLSNYDCFRADFKQVLHFVKWDLIVADECSRLKNRSTKTYKCLNSTQADRKLILSGTPIENKLDDLYNAMKWINPEIMPSYEIYKKKYLNTEWKVLNDGRSFLIVTGYKNLDEFRMLIKPFFLRKEKNEVMKDLPDLLTTKIGCELTSKEYSVYRNYMLTLKKYAAEHEPVVGVLVQLRHFLSGVDSKINETIEIVNGTEGQIIVFGEFIDSLKKVSFVLEELNITHGLIYGDVKMDERNKLIEGFQAGNLKVLVMQTKTGGYGLNLQTASTVVFLNRPYTNATEQQAISRAHRYGQKNCVNVYHLSADTPLERRVDALLEEKKNLSERVVENVAIELAQEEN